MTVHTRPPLPLTPLGYRRDGRAILPILGASPDDPGNPPTGETSPEGTDTTVVTIPQEELSRRFAREKDQGRRAGVRDLLGQLGFDSAKALTEYVQNQRHAEQQQKDAEQARLSEVERREQAAAERERLAQEREAAAVARERDAARRAVLVGLGATGTELEDAVVLLSRLAAPEGDDTALAKAAEELQERRPELFDQRAPRPSAAPPSGSPSNIPGRSGDAAARPGQIGLDIARRRGHIKST
ncbi:hypothetical protein [Streptomyces sp. CC210A]|uniref:hypothetical protein n=1 Tax=Streptomyces sp. CC210A TaxID=2898184 RepID=UPI001F442E70|nr:hypothetical protein [Streptomyces sp. CC210A]